MRRAASAFALLLLLASGLPAQSLRGIRKEFARIGEEVIPATVVIRSAEIKGRGAATSSGVIIHEKGYVLSDADATFKGFDMGPDGKPVTDEAGNPVKQHGVDALIRLPPPDFREFRAVLVKRDADTDSSLLRITDEVDGKLPVVPLGSSDLLRAGSFTVTVGNTFGAGLEGEPALSLGCVSGLLKSTGLGGGRFDMIFTSAAVNPGSNGGPCVDAEGRLVGIVSTWEADPRSPFRMLGKVTPIDRIRSRYAEVPDFDEIFPDPRLMRPRSDEAAVIEEAFSIVAHHLHRSLVSLEVVREGERGTLGIQVQGRDATGRPVTVTQQIPRFPGPYSAIPLAADGLLLTCEDNLWEFKTIKSVTAHLYDGRSLPAEVVARDRYRGVALLRVEADDLVPIPVADPEAVEVGRFALALGDPFGADRQEAPLFTFGIVSGTQRSATTPSNAVIRHLVQTDAGLVDGLVGGALVTLDGNLIGLLLRANIQRYGINSGIGFAVPMEEMKVSLDRLLAGEDVEPGWMGIALGLNGEGQLVFGQVVPGGPADKGGVKAGDALLAVNGVSAAQFATVQEFGEFLYAQEAGTVLSLKVKRGDGEHDLTVTLGARPD